MTILMSDATYERSAINIDLVESMAKETTDMVIKCVDAFVNKDLELARTVIAQDDVVDDLFADFKQQLIKKINENVKNGEQATDMLMVAKYFERIGDHATNIARVGHLFDHGRAREVENRSKNRDFTQILHKAYRKIT